MSSPHPNEKDSSRTSLRPSEAQEHIQALGAEDWQVRLSAARALATMRDPQAVAPLLMLLKAGNLRAVEPLAYACKQWRWRRHEAANALRELGGGKLPFLILSSITLSPEQKLNSLQALIGVEIPVPGFGSPQYRWRAFAIDNVQTFCEAVRYDASVAESIKHGAEAVLTELQNRANLQTLLRASGSEATQERQELLRGVSAESETTPPDELLRPSEAVIAERNREKPRILSRIFKRK
jgi:hypothetical protein